MDCKKILLNVAGVAAACYAAQSSGLMGPNTASWGTILGGLVMCVVSNQVGLHQTKP